MPFPLAHPAAVLPLRRYCPRFLIFPALAIGSVSPDFGYLVSGSGLDESAHTLVAGTAFGIAIGLGLLAVFYALAPSVLTFVSTPYREGLTSSCTFRAAQIPALVISLAIGIWTHLLLDSVTHSQGWLVSRVAWLQDPVIVSHGRTLRVCHILWYGSSFIGVAWLVVAGRKWQESHWPIPSRSPTKSLVYEATFVSLLILPIEIGHHLVHSKFGLIMVVGTTLIAVLLLICRFAARGPNRPGRKENGG